MLSPKKFQLIIYISELFAGWTFESAISRRAKGIADASVGIHHGDFLTEVFVSYMFDAIIIASVVSLTAKKLAHSGDASIPSKISRGSFWIMAGARTTGSNHCLNNANPLIPCGIEILSEPSITLTRPFMDNRSHYESPRNLFQSRT
jgi:hypothetical protein